MSGGILQEVMEQIAELDGTEAGDALIKEAENNTKDMIWVPNPGPQMECYLSEADVILFGGSGGGGKSDLLLGLAINEHHRSLIMRRQYTNLSALTDRIIEINGSSDGFKGSPPPRLRRGDQLIEFGAAKDVGKSEHSKQGHAHDFLALDEAAQFAESQVRFLMGWVRSVREGQRTRVVLASNPPLSEEGVWLISMFAPWLDPQFDKPAEPGELRWVITVDNKDHWVDGPGEYEIEGEKKPVKAQSRTFIPAKVQDNPYLMRDEKYLAYLDGLPEPLRSAIRDGDFGMARTDHALQLIPTDWIRQAQTRWREKPPEGIPMCAMGVDCTGGGSHEMVIAPRYDGYYPKLIVVPGAEVPLGSDIAARVVKHRREPALVIVDMGGGYGGSPYEHLKENGIPVIGYKGAEKTVERTKDRQLGFHNNRAKIYWRFREALDPDQPGGSTIALPPDPILVSDLCAIRLKSLELAGIRLESKEAMEERLGRSTDRGDAVVMAWSAGQRAMTHAAMWAKGEYGGRSSQNRPKVHVGRTAVRKRLGR